MYSTEAKVCRASVSGWVTHTVHHEDNGIMSHCLGCHPSGACRLLINLGDENAEARKYEI